MDTINKNNPTWEDYKSVEKELDEAYIEYATATSTYDRMLYACAIENYREALMIIYKQIKTQEGNCKTIKFGMYSR